MTREETAEITLCGQKYHITALTFAQLEQILPEIEKAGAPGASMLERLQCSGRAIAVALDKTSEEFGQMKLDVAEIIAGLDVLMVVSGMKRLGEATRRTKAS